MKNLLLVMIICLLAFALAPSVSDANCTRSTGCDDCVYSYTVGHNVCAIIFYDAYCSCTPITGGCELGTGTCDYTGPGSSCGSGPYGICPDQQNSAPGPLPPNGTDSASLLTDSTLFDDNRIADHATASVTLSESSIKNSATEPEQIIDNESPTGPDSQ